MCRCTHAHSTPVPWPLSTIPLTWGVNCSLEKDIIERWLPQPVMQPLPSLSSIALSMYIRTCIMQLPPPGTSATPAHLIHAVKCWARTYTLRWCVMWNSYDVECTNSEPICSLLTDLLRWSVTLLLHVTLNLYLLISRRVCAQLFVTVMATYTHKLTHIHTVHHNFNLPLAMHKHTHTLPVTHTHSLSTC